MRGYSTQKEEPINGEDDLTNPEENSSVDLTIANLTFNIFFDGTWNSKENSDLYNKIAPKQVKKLKDRMDERYNPEPMVGSSLSFARAPSVVDQLHRAADSDRPHVINLYTDGSGIETRTESDDASAPVPGWEYHADNGIGSGLGMGGTGAKAKLERMLEHVQTALASYVGKGNNPQQLVFNVYGFSRGAATARMFCKRIFTDRGTPEVKKFVELTKYDVVFDFVGLFDTVSSIGTNHDNDVEDDGQELNFKEIDGTKVVHIAAGDEYRQKFNLTSIGQSVRAGVGLEFIIPGCHTDIGDGLSTLGEVGKDRVTWYITGQNDENQVVLTKDRHKLPQFGSPRERRREPARYRDIEPDPNRDIEMSSFWKVFTPKVLEYQSQSFSAQQYADFDIILQSLKEEGWADNTGKAEYQCLGETCDIDTCKVKKKQAEHEAAGLIPVAKPKKATGKEAELFIRCTGDKNQLITNRKQISPDYPKVSAHLMLEFIKKYYADFYLPDKLKLYAVPAALSSTFRELKTQATALDGKTGYIDKNMHKADGNPHQLYITDSTIKNRYLHISGNNSGFPHVSVPNINNRENLFYRYVIQG